MDYGLCTLPVPGYHPLSQSSGSEHSRGLTQVSSLTYQAITYRPYLRAISVVQLKVKVEPNYPYFFFLFLDFPFNLTDQDCNKSNPQNSLKSYSTC